MARAHAKDLDVGGRRLWEAESDGLDEPALALLEEACRLKDRCDRLAQVLAGDEHTWLSLRDARTGEGAEIVVDNLLSEARQHASALKSLMTEVRQFAKRGGGVTRRPSSSEGGDGVVIDLAASVDAKRAATAHRGSA